LKQELKNTNIVDPIYQFATLLSVCHTVIPEQDENDPSGFYYYNFIIQCIFLKKTIELLNFNYSQ